MIFFTDSIPWHSSPRHEFGEYVFEVFGKTTKLSKCEFLDFFFTLIFGEMNPIFNESVFFCRMGTLQVETHHLSVFLLKERPGELGSNVDAKNDGP